MRIQPAPTEGLVSPFMPHAGTPPTAELIGAQRFPLHGCARSCPGRGAAEAEEGRAASAAARDRAQRRSRPTLQPDTFFATAKASERYSAIVDAGGWPTDIAAIGPGTKGPAVVRLRKRLAIEGDLSGRRGERACLGQRAHGGGQAFPGAHGPPPDRHRLRRDAESDQRSGEGAFQRTRLERQSPCRAQFLLR